MQKGFDRDIARKQLVIAPSQGLPDLAQSTAAEAWTTWRAVPSLWMYMSGDALVGLPGPPAGAPAGEVWEADLPSNRI